MTTSSEVVDRIRQTQPHVFALACSLSLATHVEPELLRRLRLLSPELDTSAEADLWFSDLVETQTPRGITLHPDMAELLRAALAREPDRVRASWNLTAWLHRDQPWSLRLEEALNWLSISSDPAAQEQFERIIRATARELAEAPQKTDMARWLVGALRRFPASARTSSYASLLKAGVNLLLHKRFEPPVRTVDSEEARDLIALFLPPDLERVALKVRVLERFVELDPTGPGTEIFVPRTSPLALYVRSGQFRTGRWHFFGEGEVARLPIEEPPVELQTLGGERYKSRPRLSAGPDAVSDEQRMLASHQSFFGRTDAVERLRRALDRKTTVAITGDPGSGRTALLCELARILNRAGRLAAGYLARGHLEEWTETAPAMAKVRSAFANATPISATKVIAIGAPMYQRSPALLGWLAEVERELPKDHALLLALSRETCAALRGRGFVQVLDLDEDRDSGDEVCSEILKQRYGQVVREACLYRKTLYVWSSGDVPAQELALEHAARSLGITLVRAASPEDVGALASSCDAVIALVNTMSPSQQRELERLVADGPSVYAICAWRTLVDLNLIKLQSRSFLLRQPPHLTTDETIALRPFLRNITVDPPSVLQERARGNPGRLVRMIEWLRAAPPSRDLLREMPASLYDE